MQIPIDKYSVWQVNYITAKGRVVGWCKRNTNELSRSSVIVDLNVMGL